MTGLGRVGAGSESGSAIRVRKSSYGRQIMDGVALHADG
jgi:hypothetical protein